MDRYSYTYNNPVRYVDPSGHKACDGNGRIDECKSINSKDYIEALSKVFRWKVVGSWTKKESGILLDSAIAINNRISAITSSEGLGWMYKHFIGISFVHNISSRKFLKAIDFFRSGDGTTPGIVPFMINSDYRTVLLNDEGINTNTIIHEIGHVLDNNTGSEHFSATWFGGGAADDLAKFIGVNVSVMDIRWAKSIEGKIPDGYLWSETIDKGYGNTTSADYFAQTFLYTITNPSNLPNQDVFSWMLAFIR